MNDFMLVKVSILCQFVVSFDIGILTLKKSEQAETPSTRKKHMFIFSVFDWVSTIP